MILCDLLFGDFVSLCRWKENMMAAIQPMSLFQWHVLLVMGCCCCSSHAPQSLLRRHHKILSASYSYTEKLNKVVVIALWYQAHVNGALFLAILHKIFTFCNQMTNDNNCSKDGATKFVFKTPQQQELILVRWIIIMWVAQS